jgi:hypothetical protein
VARIRSIKPEYFDDPDIGQLSAEAALTFIGIWTEADKRGRLVDDPRRLKVRVRPYSSADFIATLAELVDAGFLIRYQSSDGVKLLQVRSFERHQKTHKLEPDSHYPEPSVQDREATGKKPSDPPVSCERSLGPDLLSLDVGGETAKPPSPPPVMAFPVTGNHAQPSWPLVADYLADLQRDYEHLDVLAECKKASAWLKANPGRKKTAKGMPAFLVGWLNKAAGHGPVGVRPSALPKPQPTYDGDWFEECKLLHRGECGSQYRHARQMSVDRVAS